MSENNPWKTLESRIAYENPWMKVREDQVIRPDGNPGIYGVVETRIATATLAFNEKGELYLIGQYRYTTDCYSWELVEGGAEPDEDPLQAAKRELQEEAGLLAESWEQLGSVLHMSNCVSSEIGYIYIARGLTKVEASPDGTEELQVKTVSFAKALEMVDSGEITDAISVIGILRAHRLYKKFE